MGYDITYTIVEREAFVYDPESFPSLETNSSEYGYSLSNLAVFRRMDINLQGM